MTDSLIQALACAGLPVLEGVALKTRTTMRIGGSAHALVSPQNVHDAVTALAIASEMGAPVLYLGNGSNLLVLDGGFDGMVLTAIPGLCAMAVEGTTMRIGAGVSLAKAAQMAQSHGLSGLEALSGIPGTLGGATAMNAGAYGQQISDIVHSADTLSPTGVLTTLDHSMLHFAYRHSVCKEKQCYIVDVVLQLQKDHPETIAQRMREFAAQRREKQPLTVPSAGSFFKRPPGQFAGALIEQAGLKGFRVGDAEVSPLHAGFLVNTGHASARDMLALMQIVQERVMQQFGVVLEPEVEIVGTEG